MVREQGSHRRHFSVFAVLFEAAKAMFLLSGDRVRVSDRKIALAREDAGICKGQPPLTNVFWFVFCRLTKNEREIRQRIVLHFREYSFRTMA
jgi:hypothetical protein